MKRFYLYRFDSNGAVHWKAFHSLTYKSYRSFKRYWLARYATQDVYIEQVDNSRPFADAEAKYIFKVKA